MNSIFFRFCFFLVAFTFLVLGSCKKEHENNQSFRYHYTVDYTADKKILGYVKLEGGDTLESVTYNYLDTLVLKRTRHKNGDVNHLWYHLDGKYAWLSVDSGFSAGGVCDWILQTTYTYNAQNFCSKMRINVSHLYDGVMEPQPEAIVTFDSITGGNVRYVQLIKPYWSNTESVFWELTAALSFDDMKGQFTGRRNKNLVRQSNTNSGYKNAPLVQQNYSYHLDAQGTLLQVHELETSIQNPGNRKYENTVRVRRDSYYTYNLK